MTSDVGTIGPSPGQGARSHVLRFGPGHVFPFLHVRVWTPCPHVTLQSPHSDQPVSVSVRVAPPDGESLRSVGMFARKFRTPCDLINSVLHATDVPCHNVYHR
jgi:hypothetical protein